MQPDLRGQAAQSIYQQAGFTDQDVFTNENGNNVCYCRKNRTRESIWYKYGLHRMQLINAHGGPELRFAWTPNPQAILAVDLGIAVLSVNFRFSLDYGTVYLDAGKNDTLLPQRDLHAAVLWAIEMGIADPSRIGIMGHSYGGYSAVYQAASYPDLYCVTIP